jgi:anti-anti-sigma factor
MLDINMEFRKGILFVRLDGNLSVDNCSLLDKELERIIKNNNVKFVTFNVSGLDYIDLDGIETILKYNSALSRIAGKALICGVDKDLVKARVHNSQVPYYMFETSDELGAIDHIKRGGYL